MTIYYMEQGTPEWNEARLGIMTASKLKTIIDGRTFGLKKDLLPAISKIIAERQTGFNCGSDYISDAMQWGLDHEKDVINRFKTDRYKPVGFGKAEKLRYFGCSPDMLFFENDLPVEGFEIKCPNPEKHVEYCIKNMIPSEYLMQVIGYFIAFDSIQKMTFISHDPRNRVKEFFTCSASRQDMNDKISKVNAALIEFEDTLDEYLLEKI